MAELTAARVRRPRRLGRWVYHDRDFGYGTAGWLLGGSPLVLDFMPGDHSCCDGGPRCCRGTYLLYNWPAGRAGRERPMSRWLRYAMEEAEGLWDAYREVPCERCGRTCDDHVSGDDATLAAWAALGGCRAYVFPLAAVAAQQIETSRDLWWLVTHDR